MMKLAKKGSSRATAAIVGLALLATAPFAVMQGLLSAEHASGWHSQDAELIFWVASVSVGLIGVWLLPIRKLFRAMVTVPYIALMAVATWISSLPAVCAYFGDCL